jgi:multisubunit Na+/H+ antiporter MnhF subunit
MATFIFFVLVCIFVIQIVLFTKPGTVNKMLFTNVAISYIVLIIAFLSYTFNDYNYIDTIFFYILLSPIGSFALFNYYKYSNKITSYEKIEKYEDRVTPEDIKITQSLQTQNTTTQDSANNLFLKESEVKNTKEKEDDNYVNTKQKSLF